MSYYNRKQRTVISLMTIDQRIAELATSLQLLTLKTSSHDAELNQLTKNLNELTLKVDVFASQLREGQQTMEASHVRLTSRYARRFHQRSRRVAPRLKPALDG